MNEIPTEMQVQLNTGNVDPKYIKRLKKDPDHEYVEIAFPTVSTDKDGKLQPGNRIVTFKRRIGTSMFKQV